MTLFKISCFQLSQIEFFPEFWKKQDFFRDKIDTRFYILSFLGSLPYGVSEIASTLPDEVYSKSNLQYAKTQAPSSPIELYLTKCFKVFFTFTSFSFLYIYIAFYYRKFVMYWICVKNTYEVSY